MRRVPVPPVASCRTGVDEVTKLSNARGQARRGEYIRLRLENLDTFAAAARLGIPDSTRRMYERWFRAEHPEVPAPRRRPNPSHGWLTL